MKDANKQIIQLLTVFGAAIAVAVIAILGMLYSWGPTGKYLAKNVLLSPEMSKAMTFQDYNSKTGEKTRLVFDHVELVLYNPDTRQFRKVSLSNELYSEFYEKVSNDRSIGNPGEDVIALFNQSIPAKLQIMVRGKNLGSQTATSFQSVDFVADGNYYRVELHQDSTTDEWAYFYHVNIFNDVKELFLKDE